MIDDKLRMRPVTRDEFDAWLPRQLASYAELIASSGAMPAQAAREKAEADTARYFHRGFVTPGQFVFRILAADVPVGWLWLGVPGPEPDPRMAWVFEIEIEPAFRGHGYGRAAMVLAEAEAKSRGMTSLGLNVHGQNTVARSLYESLGYEVMAVQMKKLVLRACQWSTRVSHRLIALEQAFDKRTGLRLGFPLSVAFSKSVRIRGQIMGQKTVRFSDLSGQLIMRDDALARIVIHEHPELGDGPVEIEALADEALAMEKDALRVAVLDLYLPGEDLPRRVTLDAEAFDALVTERSAAEMLTGARPVKRAGRPRRAAS